MCEIPTLEDIGTPGTRRTYPRDLLEDETLCHLDKNQRMWTGWISTTSSLLRALQILFIEHREHGQLFVLRTAACKDIVSVPALRDCLPGLENNRYLRLKSPNEFLIRGKVEERAIVGCATVQSLHSHNLDIIAPALSNLTSWKEQQDWTREFTKSYPSHREISCELLDRAVALLSAFDMEDKAALVKRFLGLEFRIDSEGLYDWVVLDRIKMGESLRELCRAFEKYAQARGTATRAIERYTGRVGQFADAYDDFGLDDFGLISRATKLALAEGGKRERGEQARVIREYRRIGRMLRMCAKPLNPTR